MNVRDSQPERALPVSGRESELGDVRRALEQGERLVTIIGAPGIGKTWLARRLCDELAHAGRASDVVVCDLTGSTDLSAAVVAISLELGLRFDGSHDARDLGRALREREGILLVLDNFEHLVEEGAASVEAWCRSAPNATLVVTSRERLRVSGEHCVQLGPLSTQAASRLFANRVRWAAPDRPLEEALVTRLVERLDRIPLAIELAAAQIPELSPYELLQQVDEGSANLQSDSRVLDARHGSLQRAIDISWNLLASEERRALAAFSVFRGGVDVEAAREVLGPDAGDLLRRLCNKSLLQVDASSERSRFVLYETVRAFADAKLRTEPGTLADLERRHREYFARAASERVERLRDTGDREAARWLRSEQHNLFVAQKRARNRDAAPSVELGLALDELWALQGAASNRLELLDAVVHDAGTAGDAVLLTRALRARGEAHFALGSVDEAREDFARSIAAARSARSALELARTSTALGRLERHAGHPKRARRRIRAALRLLQNQGSKPDLASARRELGCLLRAQGKFVEATRELECALVLLAECATHPLIPHVCHELGVCLAALGDSVRAERVLVRALDGFRQLDDRAGEGATLCRLGLSFFEAGRLAEADEALALALTRVREVGRQREQAAILWGQGLVAQERGELDRARELYRRAQEIHLQCSNALGVAVTTAYIGIVLSEAGSDAEAEAQLRRAQTLAAGLSNGWLESLVLAHLAALRAAKDAGDAQAQAVQSRAVASGLGDPGLTATQRVLEACVDLSVGERKPSAIERARAELVSTDAALFGDARTAARLLARVVARAEAEVARSQSTLEIDTSAGRFRLPDGSMLDLRRRGPLRNVLVFLAERREQVPGQVASAEELTEAGWPGQNLLPSAANVRVRNAVATLRKMGCGAWLETRHGGYLLSPDVEVSWIVLAERGE